MDTKKDTDIDLVEGEISLEKLDELFTEEFGETSTKKEITLSEEEIKAAEELQAKEDKEEINKKKSEEETKLADEKKLEEERILKEKLLEEEKKVLENSSTSSDIFSRAKNLIELGILEDIRVATNEEDEKGTPLSEFKDISEEQLVKIIGLQQDKKKKDIDDNYIAKKNFNEDQLKIISIIENGGDLKEIFKSEKEISKPFEGLDTEDETIQKKIILHHYINNLKHTQKEAVALLRQKEEDFEVDSFSKQIVESYTKSYDDYLESKNKELISSKESQKVLLSDKRKSLSKTLKDSKFKDSVIRKIVDGVTKPTSNSGNSFQVHEALNEILKKPEENYEILLHLLDKDAYNELYRIKQRSKQAEAIVRLVDALPTDKAKKLRKDKEEIKRGDFEDEILKMDIN